jgi:hypothetical protein
MAAPTDLVSQIAELQAEFQRIADKHDWVCLAVPPSGPKYAVFLAGEKAPGRTWLGGVVIPQDEARRVIVEYVGGLTDRAVRLLKVVLEHDSQIPADIQQEIRASNEKSYGYGWVRWLWYAVGFQNVRRFEHYAQVAAAALSELKECCRQQAIATPPVRKRRRRASASKLSRLTDRQRDALEQLGRHHGDVNAAADEWHISRQAMSKLRDRAVQKTISAGEKGLAKLAEKPAAHKTGKPRRLPEDRRGQVNIADPEVSDASDLDG